MLTLPLSVEAAVADAGCGNVEAGFAQLESLLQRHADCGALVVGHLHDACVRLALEAGMSEKAEWHLSQMSLLYSDLALPSLAARVALHGEALRRAAGPEAGPLTEGVLVAGDDPLITLASRLSGDRNVDAGAALSAILELTGADRALMVSPGTSEPLFQLGDAPCQAAVTGWAHELLEDALEPELETVMAPSDDDPIAAQDYEDYESDLDAPDTETFDEVQYLSTTLWNRDGSPLGALIVGSAVGLPRRVPAPLLELLRTILTDNTDVGQARTG